MSLHVNKTKKIAFIKYENNENANMAVLADHGNNTFCEMAKSKNNQLRDINTHSPDEPESIVCNISSSDTVNQSVSKFRVYDDFKHFGRILRINIHKNRQLVFITFKHFTDAEKIIGKKINGYQDIRWPINTRNDVRCKETPISSQQSTDQPHATYSSNTRGNVKPNPFHNNSSDQISSKVSKVQISIHNPRCSIEELKKIVLQKLHSIDNNVEIISIKEDIYQINNKVTCFIFQFSKSIDVNNIRRLSLHDSWHVKLFNTNQNNSNMDFLLNAQVALAPNQ